MATNFVAKLWQNSLPPALIALSFRNRMGYRYLNVRINSVNDRPTSILCENFVKFGPAFCELKWIENENCTATRPKFHDFRSKSIRILQF